MHSYPRPVSAFLKKVAASMRTMEVLDAKRALHPSQVFLRLGPMRVASLSDMTRGASACDQRVQHGSAERRLTCRMVLAILRIKGLRGFCESPRISL